MSQVALEMLQLYTEEDCTLQDIAERYGVSRERVRQRLKPLLTPELRQNVKARRHAKIVQRQTEIARRVRPRFLLLVEVGTNAPAIRQELGITTAVLKILLDSLEDETRRVWQYSTHTNTPSQCRYNREDMLAALRQAASLNGGRIGHKRYSTLRLSHPEWPSSNLYQVRGWNYWLGQAGIPVNARRAGLGVARFSEAHCKEAAAAVAAKLGRRRYSLPEYRENCRPHDPTGYTITRRFGHGSWMAGLEYLLDDLAQ